jgi:hypothetical protein
MARFLIGNELLPIIGLRILDFGFSVFCLSWAFGPNGLFYYWIERHAAQAPAQGERFRRSQIQNLKSQIIDDI